MLQTEIDQYLKDGYVQKYGILWPPHQGMAYPDWMIERDCYLHKNGENQSLEWGDKATHLKSLINIILGHREAIEPFEMNPNAEQIIEDYCAHKWLSVVGHASSSKCLAPHTEVLMFDGSKKAARDILLKDTLMGDDSTPRRVINRKDGRSNMVRIVPEKGHPWECNDDHILVLKRSWAGWKSQSRLGDIVEIPVKEYLKRSQTFKNQFKLFCVGVEFPAQPVEFDPRMYGIWLGDGSTGRSDISLPNEGNKAAVYKYIHDTMEPLGYTVRTDTWEGKCPRLTIGGYQKEVPGRRRNPFLTFVRESCGSPPHGKDGTKRILPRYLINSRKVRMELLAGIIDTDGHAAGTNFCVGCSNDGLAEDIVFLARSLGFRVTCTPRTTKCQGKEFPTNTICIMGAVEEIPTLVKKCEKKTLRTNSDCVGFKVEQLGEGDWCGFSLDGNERFLLGDFTVSHNTRSAAAIGVIEFIIDPENTGVSVISTTIQDGKRRIWADVSRCWNDACMFFARFFGSQSHSYDEMEQFMPGELVPSVSMIRFRDPQTGRTDEARGLVLAPAKENDADTGIGRMKGFKAKRTIILLDEASDISIRIVEAVESNMEAGCDEFHCMATLNANDPCDTGGNLCEPEEGWGSLDVDNLPCWKTKRGFCRRIDAEESPNVKLARQGLIQPHEKRWNGLISLEILEKKRGDLSGPQFARQYRSRWPMEGTRDSMYSLDFLRSHGALMPARWKEIMQLIGGADPAWSHDGDRFPIVRLNYGLDESDTLVLEYHSYSYLDGEVVADQDRRIFLANKLKKNCESEENYRLKVDIRHLGMDTTGGGAFFATDVANVWGNGFHRVGFKDSPSEKPATADSTKTCKERFGTRRDEVWAIGMELVRGGQIRGLNRCPELLKQIKDATFEEKNKKIYVEDKKSMKKRLGYSPDLADAFFIAVDVARQVLGMTPCNKIAKPKAVPKANSEFNFERLEKKPQRKFQVVLQRFDTRWRH